MESGFPPTFHICRKFNEMTEDSDLLYVTIPWARLDPWELRDYLVPFYGYSSSIDTVYDRSLSRWLKKRKLQGWWQGNWPYPEYRDFFRQEYAERLLHQGISKTGSKQHFLILGFVDFLPKLLRRSLAHIKSIQLLVKEENEAVEAFIEDVYEEYGIAVNCREQESFENMRLACPNPTVILDFTGAEKISAIDAAPGSAWLDMGSLDEKRRRIEAQGGSISYFSVKKEWELSAKQYLRQEMPLLTLDTAYKNEYNT